jgi:glutathione S-transferase
MRAQVRDAYEKGIEFEKAELRYHSQRAELLRFNPRGEVPALVDGSTVVYDSRVICDYLEESHPAPALLPADAATRARCRAIETIAATQLDACLYVLGLMKLFRPEISEKLPQALAKATAALEKHWANLDRELDGKEWFVGTFTRADIAVAPHLAAAAFMASRARALGVPPSLDGARERTPEQSSARPRRQWLPTSGRRAIRTRCSRPRASTGGRPHREWAVRGPRAVAVGRDRRRPGLFSPVPERRLPSSFGRRRPIHKRHGFPWPPARSSMEREGGPGFPGGIRSRRPRFTGSRCGPRRDVRLLHGARGRGRVPRL